MRSEVIMKRSALAGIIGAVLVIAAPAVFAADKTKSEEAFDRLASITGEWKNWELGNWGQISTELGNWGQISTFDTSITGFDKLISQIGQQLCRLSSPTSPAVDCFSRTARFVDEVQSCIAGARETLVVGEN